MLSYQHIYHAGNLADVHKHACLAWMLAYLTRKDKPLSYLETHAGRGLYDLRDAASVKTGEAASGIKRARVVFDDDHPYAQALARVEATHGAEAYPGSPVVAQGFLRPGDHMHLAELHPGEYQHLRTTFRNSDAKIYHQDGLELAMGLCPPTPRRGVLLIDPSYEIKDDYARLPDVIGKLHRKWNVGVIALWYPVLTSGIHDPMLQRLQGMFDDALRHEVPFPPAREGHRMVGSGMFVLHPPYGLQDAMDDIERRICAIAKA